ncbi:carbohydrate ABC transporter permease [Paenibacillus sacheonensis]|uniref:ABC transporter permease subunit n=1 Tax=Paenibacillus sacheonensis TaxID=742054 RepID=A0A7X4YSK6_9BACL|nr:carbohydrate ABC transporter permease [Paenibacillus sacheonensis]MBM7569208.1 raffinose/stachyose/melibiose transport system permease protein [Paenibacillus sacheonensis]NBC71780.1 ABC transporter permease subunit [Paenibacillus sacheonensis]
MDRMLQTNASARTGTTGGGSGLNGRIRRGQLPMHLLLWAYVIVTLFPLVWLLLSSFKTNREITVNTWAPPSRINFSNYKAAWESAHIGSYAVNSLYVTLAACLLTLLLSSATAFALSRMRYKGLSKNIFAFILIGLIVPPSAVFIPLYQLVTDLHLMNTLRSLILVYCTYALPITIFILHAFMQSIPRELEEAGIMDGLGAAGLFARIILPVTVPALVTVFILAFIGNWNEYIFSQLFVTTESLRTLPTGMATFNDGYRTNFSSLSAAVIISILPVLAVYMFLQRQIIDGMTAGSVKG